MPTALESRAALTLVTGAAVDAVERLLGSLSGSPESVRAGLLDSVPPLIGYFSDGSSALAADFYDDERERAAARGVFQAEPVVLDRAERVGRAVAWASEPLFDGAGDLAGRLAQVVQLETARPYRDTITTNRRRDPQADGWRRVSAGGCSFCRLLSDRGAVYREESVRFAAHTHCHCTAAPVFKGADSGPEASTIQYAASKRYRTPEQRDANNAKIRAYLAKHYGD